ncbi:PAS domain-containing protein [Desulfosarcina sp.]|uniref:PAS domain-containing protein n=1 Tax=Desulfosarcina sp. TaxID=2027861 RepID=UPI0029A4BC54|nr:PAS domain-containing protein [Desulfosarcina sp.]MDX2454320.1 PAS domain-containing protein [Desulfosarcina sp.]MDX2491988.1 PAS domain-containing protein [Desulfosarcina sp.]
MGRDEWLARIQNLEAENRQLARQLANRQTDFDALTKLTRRITDNAPDMIWAKDMDNRYLFANRALCERLLMCKSPEAVVGKNDVYFADLERANGQRHTFGEVCENSDEIVKTRQKNMRFVEDGLVRGQYLVLDVHKAPLLDESGAMIGTVGCGRDITRERQIQKDLAESRASQQLLMETASDFAVFRLQVNPVRPRRLKVLFISPSAKDIAGITPSQVVNQWFQVYPDDRKALRYAYVKGHTDLKFNHRFRIFHRVLAQWRWIHVIATCVNGREDSYVNGILFDITDQMKSKEALAVRGRELASRSDNLSEVNTALKVLLKKRDEDRKALEEKVLYNVKSLIRPYLSKMKQSGLNAKQKAYLDILDSNLSEIISPLSRKLSFDYLGFTPTEIKVAAMVKQGKKAREIARMLGISTRTVEGYRYTIRDRLGIKGKKVNLRTYLLSI